MSLSCGGSCDFVSLVTSFAGPSFNSGRFSTVVTFTNSLSTSSCFMSEPFTGATEAPDFLKLSLRTLCPVCVCGVCVCVCVVWVWVCGWGGGEGGFYTFLTFLTFLKSNKST